MSTPGLPDEKIKEKRKKNSKKLIINEYRVIIWAIVDDRTCLSNLVTEKIVCQRAYFFCF